jgi:single-strand DNA-binding protein
MNVVILSGRLSTDVTLRYTQKGTTVSHFDMAVKKLFQKKNEGNAVDFFHIVIWGKLAEVCGNNLIKGRMVTVRGHLTNNTYHAEDGSKKNFTNIEAEQIEFMDYRKTNSQNIKDTQQPKQGEDVPLSYTSPMANEEIPF